MVGQHNSIRFNFDLVNICLKNSNYGIYIVMVHTRALICKEHRRSILKLSYLPVKSSSLFFLPQLASSSIAEITRNSLVCVV